MNEEKTKVECRLITCGTEKVNTRVVDDLAVPDPELATGKQIIEEALNDSQPADS